MYDLISFVNRGKVRKRILSCLLVPATPTKIANKIRTHRSTVSRAILSMAKKGLVKCITPNEKMGRYYEITQMGKKVLAKIENE